ncbi:hypothetical protein JKP88DRAFT_271417 [Tribonema minus]|uniref:Uncharacterized protein n=1 Tax=Tribonema minus TaxID=303371 RepID=A0A835ZBH9_9STRA|nr:hypothetical protein JKP88DRAFT_271417 [Tribonema minus]
MPALEVVIALLRNCACVAKSLLPHTSPVFEPFPGFKAITWLDAFIIALQLVAAVYYVQKGIVSTVGGLKDRANATAWLTVAGPEKGVDRTGSGADGKPEKKRKPSAADAAAEKDKAAQEAADMAAFAELLRRRKAAGIRRVLVGASQLIIAEGFVALALSGLKYMLFPRLVWSLTITEVALAYLLYVMLDEIRVARRLAAKARAAARLRIAAPLDTEVAELVAPRIGQAPWALPEPPRVAPTRAGARAAATALRAWRDGVPRPRAAGAAAAADANAQLEAVLLLLNVVAFVGYATIPLTYFVPEDWANAAPAPLSLLVGWPLWWPGHEAASWWGNLAGDVAWSVEPALMLAAPLLIGGVGARRRAKAKSA